jgi:hypothetical protein
MDKEMSCDKISEELSAYLDGELSGEEKEAVRAHLEGCADCRELLEKLRETAGAVKELPPVRAPKDLRDKVMASVAKESERRRVTWGRRLWPVAATILIASILYLMDKDRRADEQPGQQVAMTERSAEQRGRAQEYAQETYMKASPEPTPARDADEMSIWGREESSERIAADETIPAEGFNSLKRATEAEAETPVVALPSAPMISAPKGSVSGRDVGAVSAAASAGMPVAAAVEEKAAEAPPVLDIVVYTNNDELAYRRVNELAISNGWWLWTGGEEWVDDKARLSAAGLARVEMHDKMIWPAPTAKEQPEAAKKITLYVNNLEILEIGNSLADAGLLGPEPKPVAAGGARPADNSVLIASNIEVLNDGAELKEMLSLNQQMNQSQKQMAQWDMSNRANFYFRRIPAAESTIDAAKEANASKVPAKE